MLSDLHGNVVHHGVELMLLVSMLFLLAIPKSLLILMDFYTLVISHICIWLIVYLSVTMKKWSHLARLLIIITAERCKVGYVNKTMPAYRLYLTQCYLKRHGVCQQLCSLQLQYLPLPPSLLNARSILLSLHKHQHCSCHSSAHHLFKHIHLHDLHFYSWLRETLHNMPQGVTTALQSSAHSSHLHFIRCRAHDVYLGMCLIKMAWHGIC